MHCKAVARNVRFWLSFKIAPPSSYRKSRSRSLSVQAEELPQLENLRQWLDQQHNQVDPHTCSRLLHTCGHLKALAEGKRLHALIRAKGLHTEISMANCILNMYGKCRSLQGARAVFDQIVHGNVVSWTAMIGIYAKNGLCIDALKAFQHMQLVPVCPNEVTFITVLNACSLPEFAAECNLIYTLIVHYGCESDVRVGNALVTAYGKCGSTVDAHAVFGMMIDRNVVSWTTMIKAFAEPDHDKAFELLQQMLMEGVKTNNVTYITLLDACFSPESLLEGKRIHAMIVEIGGLSDVVLGSALVNMYGKCGRAEDACRMFNVLPQRNVVTWNAMIAIFAHHGLRKQAFQHFEQMQLEGVKPDSTSFITVLGLCTSPVDSVEGKIIHACGVQVGLDSGEVVGCALVDMYGKCGNVVDAHRNFNKLQKRNVLSWSCLIAAHAKVGHTQDVLVLFYQMQLEGVQPNEVTFSSLLSAFGNPAVLGEGKMIHVQVKENLVDVHDVVGSSLVSMYGRCGDLEAARKAFENIHKRSVVAWNAVIGAHGQHGHGKEFLELFQLMQLEDVKPNNISFSCVLSACADMGLLGQGEKIHGYIVDSELEADVVVGSALINMYGKCGRVEEAQRMFDRMRERNLITWNSIIAAHALHGHSKEVLEFFEQMRQGNVKPSEVTVISILDACISPESMEEGKMMHDLIIRMGLEAIPVIGNALINMYANCGTLREAQSAFNRMPERNLVSWNTMIGVYASYMHVWEIFQLFQEMQQEGIEFDKITFVHALSACASLSAMAEGKMVYACAIDGGLESDVIVGSALVSMYSKSGHVEDAQNVFDKMQQHDVVSWTAMIVAHAQHGHAKEAFQLFRLMQKGGVKPSHISFVSILSACSHAGLVDEGCTFFLSMIQEFGMTPTASHYSCLIDLFGRSGQLDKAEDLITKIPMQPVTAMWMTLLGACKAHGDVERGKGIAKRMFQLNQQCSAAYSLLSGMHAIGGFLGYLCGDFVAPKGLNMDSSSIEQFGQSFIETNGQVPAFPEKDNCCPEMDEIYDELKTLSRRLDFGLALDAKDSFLSADYWSEMKEEEVKHLASNLCVHH